MNKVWTDEKTAQLRDLYPCTPTPEVAVLLGMDLKQVRIKAKRLKLLKTKEQIRLANRGQGYPTIRKALLAACKGILEQGCTFGQIHATSGLSEGACKSHIERAMKHGEMFAVGRRANYRYFGTKEGAESARDWVEQEAAERKAQALANRNANQRAKYARKAAERPKAPRKPRTAKPKPPKAPKSIVFAKSTKKPATKRCDLPVIIPDHVKVQVLPGYTGAPAWEMRGKTW